MTDNHPITPPPELLQQWTEYAGLVGINEYLLIRLATQAARWGADQQLELDAKWLDNNALYTPRITISPSGDALRKVMRPKPKNLKEQALQALENADGSDHPVVTTVLTADQHAMNSQETPNDLQIRSSEVTPQVDAGDLHIATQAADWQLKRVIEWLNNNLSQSNYLEPLWPYKIDVDGVLCDLKEAMRPQQQEDNHD